MDPVSALGTASAILTFIDFSWTLVRGTIEVHRNGRIEDDQDISTIVTDLEAITYDLRKGSPGSTRAERSIANLSEQCFGTSQELQKLLQPLADDFQVKRTFWKSLKTQWTLMAGKEKIDELSSKLRGYREQLMLNLSFLVREDQSRVNIQLRSIQDSFGDLNLDVSKKFTSLRNSLAETIQKEMRTPPAANLDGETVSFIDSLDEIKNMVANLQSSIVDMPIQQRILRQLAFAQMSSRHSKICNAEAGSLRWIFGRASPVQKYNNSIYDKRQKVRSDVSHQYLEWLEKGTGVFHVSGNTGSGKSALMKYLAGHELTKERLELWAGTKTLVLAEFYFWAPGNELQRSLDGMRRTLLFGALSQHPELIQKIFPQQWRRMKASSFSPDALVEGIQEFGQQQIDDAFAMLVESRELSDYKLCFFIDGLDELSGDRQDHENLAEQICCWAEADNVKLCVSSRPWPEFKDIFRSAGHPIVYLHQLNKPDIYAYCREKFAQDRKGKLLPQQDRQNLVEAITKKSQGIFLWTFLVVRQLLNALRNDDPLHLLKKRLDEVPQHLEELYAKSLEYVSKSKIDRTRAYRMLLLALENPLPQPLNALAYSWIPEFYDLDSQGLRDAKFLHSINLDSYSDAEVRRRIQRVTAQIWGLTRDFLDVSFDVGAMSAAEFTSVRRLNRLPVVDFFHRSARDYLWENEIQRASISNEWPDFDTELIYFKIHLAEINLVPHGASDLSINSKLGQYLINIHNRNNGVALLRKFQTSVIRRDACKHFWGEFLPFNSGSKRRTPVYDLSTDSLVHVGAYYGLEKFTLDEVDIDPGALCTKNDANLLVSAAMHQQYVGDCVLVGKLLDRHLSLDGTHPVSDDGTGLVKRWPVWVIVSAALLQRLLCNFTTSKNAHDLMRDLVRINEYAADQGWSSTMSFKFYNRLGNMSCQSRQIDVGEIVRFCQTLEPWVERISGDIRWAKFLLGTYDTFEGLPFTSIWSTGYEIHEVTWKQ